MKSETKEKIASIFVSEERSFEITCATVPEPRGTSNTDSPGREKYGGIHAVILKNGEPGCFQ